MRKTKNLIASGDQYNRYYGSSEAPMRGVDFSSDEKSVNTLRFSYAKNMWKDYDSELGASIETFPGWREVFQSASKGAVNGMWAFKDHLIVHSGHSLYTYDSAKNAASDAVKSDLADRKSAAAIFGDVLYLIDGNGFYAVKYEPMIIGDLTIPKFTVKNAAEAAYIPTLYKGHTGLEEYESKQYEQRNMLTDKAREVLFFGDGEKLADPTNETSYFWKAPLFARFQSIDRVEMDGIVLGTDTNQSADGWVYEPIIANEKIIGIKIVDVNNYEIYDDQFRELAIEGTLVGASFRSGDHEESYLSAISGCRLICSYDGRIFLSGNPKFPNTTWYSGRTEFGANYCGYIGELNYFNDGTGSAPNTALIPAGSILLVTKGQTSDEAAVYYHYGADGGSDLIPRIYPCSAGVDGIGCNGAGINFLDDPCLISSDGVNAVGKSNVTLERTIVHRSSNVDAMMRAEDAESAMCVEWQGYLCVLYRSGNLYLADSRQRFESGITGATEYEWFFVDGVRHYVGNKIATLLREAEASEDLYIYDYEQELYHKLTSAPDGGDTTEWGYAPAFKFDGVSYNDAGFSVFFRLSDYAYVIPTDEVRASSEAYPTSMRVVDDELYFGFSDGAVCKLNTDRRGKRGYKISTSAPMDGVLTVTTGTGASLPASFGDGMPGDYEYYNGYLREEYEPEVEYLELICDGAASGVYSYGHARGGKFVLFEAIDPAPGEIPARYYNRCGTRFESRLATKYDDCGYPHVLKTTIRNSAVACLKGSPASVINIDIRTDRTSADDGISLSLGAFDLSDVLFGNFSFKSFEDHDFVIHINRRNWLRQQYIFSSSEFCAPWGLAFMAFRFRIAGRVKF